METPKKRGTAIIADATKKVNPKQPRAKPTKGGRSYAPEGVGAGRKAREVTQEMLDQMKKLAALGMNTGQICAALGVSESWFYEKAATTNPELMEHIKVGKALGISKVAAKLMEKINDMDTTSIIFYLKTQAGWREGVSMELTGPNGGPLQHQTVDLKNLSDKELDALEHIASKATQPARDPG